MARFLLIAPPHLPLYLLLPETTASPAERRAKQDGEAEAQDAQEDPWKGMEMGKAVRESVGNTYM